MKLTSTETYTLVMSAEERDEIILAIQNMCYGGQVTKQDTEVMDSFLNTLNYPNM